VSPLAEARDPRTPSARLLQLAGSGDPQVMAAVAAHPRAPIAALGLIVLEAPAAACAHPRLNRVGRRAFATWTAEMWAAAAGEPSAPPRLVQLATSSVPAAFVVLLRADLSPGVRQLAVAACRGELRFAAAGIARRAAERLPVSDEHLEALLAGGIGEQLAAACAPSLSTSRIDVLVGDAPPELAAALAGHPATSAAALVRLAERFPRAVGELISREDAPTELLLAADPHGADVDVLRRLLARGAFDRWLERAMAVELSPRKVEHLLADIDRSPGADLVVAAFARHPNPEIRAAAAGAGLPLSDGAWASLIHDPAPVVRERLASRRDVLPEASRLLGDDPSPGVRAVLAGNSSVPFDWVHELWFDQDLDVRVACRGRPDIPPEQLEAAPGSHRRELLAILSHASLEAEFAARWTSHPDAVVRAAAARHPSLAALTTAELLGHPSEEVRRVLAWRQLSLEVAEDLAQDPSDRVRAELARSAHTPTPARALLLFDRSPRVRAALASAAGTPAEWLARLAADPEPQVRWAAAQNPRTPAGLRELAERSLPRT
jgi:hypothetical protein